MKVHRRIVFHPTDPDRGYFGDRQSIEIVSVEWCCRRAQEDLVKMYQGEIGITRPGWEGDSSEDAIEFCPWCGENIEYIEEPPIRRVPVATERTVKVYEYHDEAVKQ